MLSWEQNILNKLQLLFQNLTEELFSKEDVQLKLVEDFFSVDQKGVSTEFELEVIEIQASPIYKTKHKEIS